MKNLFFLLFVVIVSTALFFSTSLFAQQQAKLTVEPLVLDYGWTLNNLELKITNSGTGVLYWTAEENPNEEWLVINHNTGAIATYRIKNKDNKWLSLISNSSGALGPGESDYLQVVVNRELMYYQGTNYGEIIVTSNGGNQPVDVIIEVGNTPTTPILHVYPNVLDFNIELTTLKFLIKNRGVGTLTWSAFENPDESWITSLSPSSGSLASMAEQEVSVTVTRSSLNDGIYSGLISVSSNAGNDQVEVELIKGDRPAKFLANVGGFSYNAQNNKQFSTDRPYREGAWGGIRGHKYSVTSDISNTQDDIIYQTELFWIDGYRFDISNGNYTVIFHFAELYYNYVGGRVFDVYIENQLVLDHFDIFAQAGFQTATTRTFSNVQVTDGRLDIDFGHHNAHAKLSAIEIISDEPILSATPTQLDFGASETTMTLTITNTGGGILNWNAYENPEEAWITSIVPSNGSLTANQSTTVNVSVDRTGLDNGDYTGTITVSSNGGEQNIVVSMEVIPPSAYIKRVNCGGSAYVDGNGNAWDADRQYSSGSWGSVGGSVYSTSDAIANTNDDLLYQSERWGLESYRFDVPNGIYEVKLLFAEVYFTQNGKRVFHVKLEGEQVLTNYDIHAEVGHDYATHKLFTTEVKDGQLNIEFSKYIEDPKISAIQIISKSSDPILSVNPTLLDFGTTTTTMAFTVSNNGGGTLNWTAAENPDETWITSVSPGSGTLASLQSNNVTVIISRNGLAPGAYTGTITVTSNAGTADVVVKMTVSAEPVYVQRVNCGGSAYTDGKGNVWAADKVYAAGSWGYTTGNIYTTTDPIANTEDDILYQTERWATSLSYRFDVNNGSYNVTLHFAEIYYQRSGIRVIDVSLENQLVIDDYDIYADVGHDVATSKSFLIAVTDGRLDIDFRAEKNAAKISAIEVIWHNALQLPDQNWDSVTNASIDDVSIIPETFALYQNYPNPFNPETVIGYQLSKESTVRLEIYNISGQLIRQFISENQPAGYYQVRWDGKTENNQNIVSGIYIYILKTDEFIQSRRMVYLR